MSRASFTARQSPGVDTQPTSPTVAMLNPSGRAEKIAEPLRTVGVRVSISPTDPWDHDFVFMDIPGFRMAKTIADAPSDANVLYRIRGNVWRAFRHGGLGRVKRWTMSNVIFPRLDGAIAADPYLEYLWHDRTGHTRTDVVGLPITAEEWPSATHTGHELRLATLTNCNYPGKVDPICNVAPIVDKWLEAHGGQWIIGGEGEYEGVLAAAVEELSHVHFGGYLDAKDTLAQANVMLHPSEFDIQLPNAILEGMASKLPVVTTAFQPFNEHDRLLSVGTAVGLQQTLDRLQSPEVRAEEGEKNRRYVAEHHTPEHIGEQFASFFEVIR